MASDPTVSLAELPKVDRLHVIWDWEGFKKKVSSTLKKEEKFPDMMKLFLDSLLQMCIDRGIVSKRANILGDAVGWYFNDQDELQVLTRMGIQPHPVPNKKKEDVHKRMADLVHRQVHVFLDNCSKTIGILLITNDERCSNVLQQAARRVPVFIVHDAQQGSQREANLNRYVTAHFPTAQFFANRQPTQCHVIENSHVFIQLKNNTMEPPLKVDTLYVVWDWENVSFNTADLNVFFTRLLHTCIDHGIIAKSANVLVEAFGRHASFADVGQLNQLTNMGVVTRNVSPAEQVDDKFMKDFARQKLDRRRADSGILLITSDTRVSYLLKHFTAEHAPIFVVHRVLDDSDIQEHLKDVAVHFRVNDICDVEPLPMPTSEPESSLEEHQVPSKSTKEPKPSTLKASQVPSKSTKELKAPSKGTNESSVAVKVITPPKGPVANLPTVSSLYVVWDWDNLNVKACELEAFYNTLREMCVERRIVAKSTDVLAEAIGTHAKFANGDQLDELSRLRIITRIVPKRDEEADKYIEGFIHQKVELFLVDSEKKRIGILLISSDKDFIRILKYAEVQGVSTFVVHNAKEGSDHEEDLKRFTSAHFRVEQKPGSIVAQQTGNLVGVRAASPKPPSNDNRCPKLGSTQCHCIKGVGNTFTNTSGAKKRGGAKCSGGDPKKDNNPRKRR